MTPNYFFLFDDGLFWGAQIFVQNRDVMHFVVEGHGEHGGGQGEEEAEPGWSIWYIFFNELVDEEHGG